jgi:hypothetical protein
VDEVILKFEGRSTQKITIFGKPILTGFKIFALEDSGYIINWEYIKPGLNKRVLTEKKQISIRILNFITSILLNPTQFIVIRLIQCLSIYIEKGHLFHLFLDNLFIY